jgi:folate-dependent phosphoribosylglycinamide formyltransferase PurN
VPIFPNDTEQSLSARVLEIEHKIFVATISLICSGKIKRADDKVFLNENLLGKQGIKYDNSIERMLKE